MNQRKITRKNSYRKSEGWKERKDDVKERKKKG